MQSNTSLLNMTLQSKVISFLRFPLIVAVVMIHSSPQHIIVGGVEFFDDNNLGFYGYIYNLITEIIAQSAVPLFFFISGFLFFKGEFTYESYLRKLKRRAKTILLPYIIWNLFVILMTLCLQIFASGLTSGNRANIVDLHLKLWPTFFLNYDGTGSPICYQMWFLRDLMVAMVLSPILYWGIRILRQYFILILGILWLTNYWIDVPGISIAALFFFSAGSYFNINKINFVETLEPFRIKAAVLYILLCFTNLYFFSREWVGYVHGAAIIAGMIVAITLSSHFIKTGKWKVNEFLSESSFFIYAYHALVIGFVAKMMVIMGVPATSMGLLAAYLIAPTITILIGLGIYSLLKRWCPGFTGIITGGR